MILPGRDIIIITVDDAKLLLLLLPGRNKEELERLRRQGVLKVLIDLRATVQSIEHEDDDYD